MLTYERRIVSALVTAPGSPEAQDTEAYVAGALGAMPELLRFGIAAISVILDLRRRVFALLGGRASPAEELKVLEAHPLGPVRQWVRALRSLVLFSEQEALELAER